MPFLREHIWNDGIVIESVQSAGEETVTFDDDGFTAGGYTNVKGVGDWGAGALVGVNHFLDAFYRREEQTVAGIIGQMLYFSMEDEESPFGFYVEELRHLHSVELCCVSF